MGLLPTLLVSVYVTRSSPDELTLVTGKGLANPTALLLSSMMMLRLVFSLFYLSIISHSAQLAT